MRRCLIALALSAGAAAGGSPSGAVPPAGGGVDERLAAARKYVEKSDRYLHHSLLRRGMEGYGLTVLEGVKPVRFKLKILSVMQRWAPHRDVILAMMSEQNLEHTRIVAGMSGSPCYVRDPRDGRDKLIGAVAYGWFAQQDPMAGIQPITQMLAAGGAFDRHSPGAGKAAASGAAGRSAQVLAAAMDPRKLDFLPLCLPPGAEAAGAGQDGGAPRLVPLVTPLMVTGAAPKLRAELARLLRPLGMVPVASGGAGGADANAPAVREAKLVPGAGIAVPLVSGDADLAAVGTVTDVDGRRVLAFGHGFFGEGELELPIAPAYVHTVVTGLTGSFKLASALAPVGALGRDENVGVAGTIGAKAPTVPMTVAVRWADGAWAETYHYALARHRWITIVLARMMLDNSISGWRSLPPEHTVRYEVAVDFGKMGTFRSRDCCAAQGVGPAMSDLARPLMAMMNNPFGPEVVPQRIDVSITVAKGDESAEMTALRLDGETYRPGETVTGVLTIRPHRKERRDLPVRFTLPADIDDGNYTLTVCDARRALYAFQAEQPQLFAPQTTEELFAAVQRVVAPASRKLYLRLPLRAGGGLALAGRELPDLPDSKASILAQARLPETRKFSHSLVQTIDTELVVGGSLSAALRVVRRPDETILRGKGAN